MVEDDAKQISQGKRKEFASWVRDGSKSDAQL